MIAGYNEPEVLEALPKAKFRPRRSETSWISLSTGVMMREWYIVSPVYGLISVTNGVTFALSRAAQKGTHRRARSSPPGSRGSDSGSGRPLEDRDRPIPVPRRC